MEYKIKPWAHQLAAITAAQKIHNYALFMEMGTGKTSTAINIIRHLSVKKGRLLRTLILGPPIVISNWRSEIKANSNIGMNEVICLTGHNRERLECLLRHFSEPRIIITNYESLLMTGLFTTLKKYDFEAIILDESHRCKDYKTRRSKLAYELCNPKGLAKPHTYLLSGSPVLNSPLDLFHQFKIMDNGETFGDNFFAFRARYFYDKNAGMPSFKHFPDWRLLPRALDQINQKMQRCAMRVEKKDCLDLPPMVYKTHLVPMSKEQQTLYDEMKKDFIAFVNDKACVATMALTKGLRLMQIASGYLKVVDIEGNESEHEIEENPKLEALEHYLSELTPHHKVLVWCVFKKNYEQIRKVCEKLKVKYVEVHGEISGPNKQKAVDSFNADKDVRVFIGHPGSGGIGINLVSASYSIFYSRTFSLEQSIQAEARNYRGGSKEAGHDKITRIDLVAEKSIEEEIVKSLNNKQEISFHVLKDLSGII